MLGFKIDSAMKLKSSAAFSPPMQDSYRLLIKSEKFAKWNPEVSTDDKHFDELQLAEAWDISVRAIRTIFRLDPEVLKTGKSRSLIKRGYFTLRIPKEVAKRLHWMLTA